MDYGKLLDRQITKVFKQMQSLTITATLNLRSGESFNFASASKEDVNDGDKEVQILVVKTTHGLKYVRKQILMETEPTLDQYDTITIANETWQLSGKLLDNGFVQMLEISNG